MRDIQKIRLYSKRFDTSCKNFQKWMERWGKRFVLIKAVNELMCRWFNKPREVGCFGTYFFGFQTIYRILFLWFSIAALVHSGYWYCGCLLYVFLRSKLLAQVLTALSRSGKCIHFVWLYSFVQFSGSLKTWNLWCAALQLLIVFLLGLFVTFIYAVVSFVFFHAYFSNEVGLFCNTLTQCFATVTRTGLLSTLGDVSINRSFMTISFDASCLS